MSDGGRSLTRYVETAFKVQVKRRPSKLLCVPLYGITGRDVGILRSRLRDAGCPSTIRRMGGELMLCYVPGDECAEVLKEYVAPGIKSLSPSVGELGEIIHDAIRMEVLRRDKSFRIMSGRVVDTRSRGSVIEGLFVRYEAYKTCMVQHRGSLCFAVDRAYKLEPAPEANLRNIAERWPEILENVDQVKVIEGSRRAFMLTHRECDSSRRALAERLLEFMEVRADSINWEEAVLYEVQPPPLSYTFKFMLRRHNLLIGENGVTCLPDVVLYPVASLDAITRAAAALNREVKVRLTLPPWRRLWEARELVSRVSGDVAFGELEFLLEEEPLEIPTGSEDLVAAKSSLFMRSARPMSQPKIDKVFDPWDYYEAIKAPSINEIRIAVVRRRDVEAGRLGAQAGAQVKAFEESLKNRLLRETRVQVEIEDEDFDGSLSARDSAEGLVSRLKGSNYNAVIAPVTNEEEYAFFEYYAAKLGLLPQSIDLSKRTDLKLRALSIARHFEYKLGYRLAQIAEHPQLLKDHVIVALDATPIMFRGYAKVGVTPVITDPSFTDIQYLDPIMGENEEEVIRGCLSVLAEERYDKVLVYVNRTRVQHSILEDARSRFNDLVVVAVSRRGVPRLIKMDGGVARLPERGTFVWHGVEEVGSFREYSFVGVTNIVEKSDLTPITGVYRVYVPKDVELDAGTRAALFSYVQSSTMVFVESPMYLPSLPQPLHEAHRLSKKLFKVARWVPIAELRRDILKNL